MLRFLLLGVFMMAGCHDSKLNREITEKPLDTEEDSSDLSDNVAIEPTAIGGAYLICADDPALHSGTGGFGCRLEDELGGRLEGFMPQTTDIVAIIGNQSLTPDVQQDTSSFWHWTFAYQDSDRSAYTIKFLIPFPGLANPETSILEAHPGQAPKAPGTPATSARSHIIFVTSTAYGIGEDSAQEFNSLESADAKCNQHASNAKLPGSFRAMLSTANTAARDRIQLSAPIILTDGDVIANVNLFWSESHAKPIIRDEFANSIGGGTVKVWTGTLSSGRTAPEEHCDNWTATDSDAKGRYGLGDKEDVWISDGQEGCDQSLRLYCISQ
ncbi:hypothetical protein [Oligoflexus tunisiensis]|uniref:hypothetical protein n=1 Tax=Oligoflexus tunisiensis TaxID=708132 RepID=UPI00114D376A|nr:hypothetical protein [Oligoflexus tunisiensis]